MFDWIDNFEENYLSLSLLYVYRLETESRPRRDSAHLISIPHLAALIRLELWYSYDIRTI